MPKSRIAVRVIPEADKSEKFLTVLDVASLLNVRPSTVYQWASSGEIPHYRLGRIVRFKRKDLEAWVEGFRKERADEGRKATQILRATGRGTQDIGRIIKKSIAEVREIDILLPWRNQVKNGFGQFSFLELKQVSVKMNCPI